MVQEIQIMINFKVRMNLNSYQVLFWKEISKQAKQAKHHVMKFGFSCFSPLRPFTNLRSRCTGMDLRSLGPVAVGPTHPFLASKARKIWPRGTKKIWHITVLQKMSLYESWYVYIWKCWKKELDVYVPSPRCSKEWASQPRWQWEPGHMAQQLWQCLTRRVLWGATKKQILNPKAKWKKTKI